MSDINRVVLTGTIAEPRITWLDSGKAELRLRLTVEQDSPFKLYVQVFVYSKDCERLAETLQAGDRVFIGDGRLSWRSTTKNGAKVSTMVVTCYQVEVLQAAQGTPGHEDEGEPVLVASEPSGVTDEAPKTRTPRRANRGTWGAGPA